MVKPSFSFYCLANAFLSLLISLRADNFSSFKTLLILLFLLVSDSSFFLSFVMNLFSSIASCNIDLVASSSLWSFSLSSWTFTNVTFYIFSLLLVRSEIVFSSLSILFFRFSSLISHAFNYFCFVFYDSSCLFTLSFKLFIMLL